MSPLHSISFWKRRSVALWIAFSLCGAALLVRLAGALWTQWLEDNWESVYEARRQEQLSNVRSVFQKYQQQTHREAQRLGANDDLLEALTRDPDRARLFSILERSWISSEMSVEIYGSAGRLVAWWGRTAGLHHARVDVQRETSFVSAGSVYSYLTVVEPLVRDRELVGFAVVHRLFDVNYPLNNRFISSAGFTQTFPQQFDFPVRFVSSLSGLSGKIPIPLHGTHGEVIGFGVVDEPSPEAVIGSARTGFAAFERLGYIGASVILFLVLFRWFDGLQGWFSRLFSVSVLLWIVRYFWLWLGFPSGLLTASVFDPRLFASPFGFGITKSPGDFLLTSFVLLVNVSYGAFQLLPRILENARPETHKRDVFWAILLILSPLAFATIQRGFTAAVRSAVFDSTLRYNDPTSLLPGPEVAIMLLGLLCIAVASVFVFLGLVLLGFRIAAHWLRSPVFQRATVAACFAAVCMIFGFLHPNPLVGQVPRLFVVAGVFAGAVVLLHRSRAVSSLDHLPRFRLQAAATCVAVAIPLLVFHLDDQVHQRERRAIELLGAEISRPVDAWMEYVLEQALQEMRGEESAEALTSDDPEQLRSLAFKLWAKSMLGKQGYNSGVAVFDPEGHLVSTFRIGMRYDEFARMLESNSLRLSPRGARTITSVATETPVGKLKVYSGWSEVTGHNGRALGQVRVVASAPERAVSSQGTLPVFQTSEVEETERYVRTLVISEFVDNRLRYTTGQDMPVDRPLDHATLSTISAERAVWIDEVIENHQYETFYVRQPGDRNRILALAWRKPDWRWHVFDYLRHVLFYLLTCGLLILIYVIARFFRGKGVALSFREKLFLAFVAVSFIPLLSIAYLNREFTVERSHQSIVERLTKETAGLQGRLLRKIQAGYVSGDVFARTVADDWCESAAGELGSDFSLYVDAAERASSKPELFQAEILDARLSASAYQNVVLKGKNFFAENRVIGNYDYLVGYRPLLETEREKVVLAVPLLYSQVEIAEDLARRNALLFGAYAVVMILAVIIGTIFANQISLPIRQLIGATRRIAGGEMDFRLPTTRKDELGELHTAFNQMTADLERHRESLLKAERELAWKEMAKQVAHEIKNPLTPMKLSIQHLRQAFLDKEKTFPQLLEQVTRTIIDQIEALSRIALQFASFARMPERREEELDLRGVLDDAVQLFKEHDGTRFTFSGSAEPMILRADREELRRAFINIFRNAVQAMEEKGVIAVETTVDAENYRITIRDSGPGIPPDIQPRLFEPNFSTKSEGMGMGLAITKKTIDDLHGGIEIDSSPGRGTTVKIVLPRGGYYRP